MVIGSLLLLVLILGSVSLGIGLSMSCGYSNGYSYYDSCTNIRLSLLINGGVLIGFTGNVSASAVPCLYTS